MAKKKGEKDEEMADDTVLAEEDLAIKARSGKTKDSSERRASGMDEDDVMSDQEQEIMAEINDEMDGRVKVAKDVRGYDDGKEDGSDNISAEKQAEEVEKFTKPLREAHSKYLQFLKGIEHDKENNSFTVHVAFPLEFKKVLMLTLAEQALSHVLVRQVPGIEKCTLIKPKKEGEEPYLVVQGINFRAFFDHSHIIDLHRLETNHSYALKAKYGVEAMRANIVKEVLMVFGVYGIAVDKRHLSLIGDFMTFNGDYRAFNRIGMEESSSPFLKMSYETTLKYLVSASQGIETDDMSAPSSAVVMGQIPRVGTGMFDVLH
jgi:DNA-directed RNA polymerase I subunit RPA1